MVVFSNIMLFCSLKPSVLRQKDINICKFQLMFIVGNDIVKAESLLIIDQASLLFSLRKLRRRERMM